MKRVQYKISNKIKIKMIIMIKRHNNKIKNNFKKYLNSNKNNKSINQIMFKNQFLFI